MKIALDAGHGLKTAGKQTPTGIKEWSLNDKVRDKVVDILKDYDVEIIHTDNNEGNTDESLSSRLKKYINAGVNAFVSIHHNAFTGDWNNATGVEIYTDKNPTSEDSRLAKCIYSRLVNNTKLKGRGIRAVNWAVINQNRIPAVLVEGGFMDGKSDYKYITSDEGQTAYAKAVAEGLIEFLGLKKKNSADNTPKDSADNTSKDTPEVPFLVRVKINNLNIRKGPGTNYSRTKYIPPNVYTIVEVKPGKGSENGWGRLKSGAGWISLDFVTRV